MGICLLALASLCLLAIFGAIPAGLLAAVIQAAVALALIGGLVAFARAL
jgi:hypothetical protein